MSDTPNDSGAPSTNSTDEKPSEASASAAAGAVDTGRRIDPSLLQRQQPRQTMRRGGRPAPPESAIEVPEGAEGAAGVVRVVEPAKDFGGQQRGGFGVVDAATIAARADKMDRPAAAGGDEEAEAPRRDRPRGPRPGGDRGPPRGDRKGGPRRGSDREEKREARPRGPDFSDMAPIVVQRDEDVGDFAAMLAESGGVERQSVRVGDKVRATCVHIGSDAVFFELSKTQQATAPKAEFLDDKTGALMLKVGDRRDLFVVQFKDGIQVSPKLGKGMIDVGMLETARENGIPIDGTITGVNKGGFEISLAGSSRGFCPLGQIDIHFTEDPQSLVGKTLSFLVREVKEGGKNVVLTRRALLEKERQEKAEKLRERLAVGLVLEGVVTRIQPFGAFVDIGGMDGLVPVSELTYGRVASPGDVVRVGEQVKVEVVKIEDDPKRQGQLRIGLSMKAMQTDPLVHNMNQLSPGAQLVGKVLRLESFGAFVEIFPGVEGLVHVSEISDRRIRHPEDVLQAGESVSVRVKDVDLARRRVSLSMRDADAEAVAMATAQAERQQKDQARRDRLGRGTRVVGVVDRIERYGVFVNLYPEGSDPTSTEKLATGLMPASETGTPRGADLGKAFPIGTQLTVLVIDIDERGRVKVSKTAREQAEERALVDEYKKDKGQVGAGLGTFGDLLKSKFSK